MTKIKIKIKEVSEEEFRRAVDKKYETAWRLAHENIKNSEMCSPQWFFTDNEADYYSYIPCCYQKHGPGYIKCPITEEDRRLKPRPQSFQSHAKTGVQELHHASDTTCININMRSLVRCYAMFEGKYYICEHKAGRCPWKD